MFTKIVKKFYSSSSYSFSDVIICGGGLIGTTIACTLAKHPIFVNKSITLIEASPQHEFIRNENYSNRVIAISPFSKKLFERIGVWKNVQRCKEVHDMKVWGIYSNNFFQLNNNNSEDPVLAYIVENGELVQAVYDELKTLKNVTMLHKKSISSVEIDKCNISSLPKVLLKDGPKYSCNLLVGSDGFNSLIRKAMDVDYLSWDYHQMAVVATLDISDCCSNKTAWQRFLPDGPIALLPITEKLSSLVRFTTKENARKLLKMPDENFIDTLNSSLNSKMKPNELIQFTNKGINSILTSLGLNKSRETIEPPTINSVIDGSRAAFPIGFGHSPNYVLPHVILIGDAAHRIHPLAGQGVNLGFKDIDILEKVLSEGIKNGNELGNINDLKIYESLCQQNNIPVMAFIDIIHRIYTSDSSPVQAFGDIGIQLASSLQSFNGLINTKALFLRS